MAKTVADPTRIVLILGSAPAAIGCRDWDGSAFTDIVAINNAWRIRSDWDYLIHPEDFAADRLPKDVAAGQQVVTHADYVPIQNRYGGFVYAGGTMAFTAGYWALGALEPDVLAFFGCDMIYPARGATHFYGTGKADPLRDDISLRDLGAKSLRLAAFAARQGCHAVNLSTDPSKLLLPRADRRDLVDLAQVRPDFARDVFARAVAEEDRLGYRVPSGRYWDADEAFDPVALDRIDAIWRETLKEAPA